MYSKEKESFGLIRTNAALTGNIKLTVSSDYALSINSIDGHPFLADTKYKAVNTNENSSYHQDVAKVFGGLSPRVIFNVDADPLLTSVETYSKQYDFRYSAGAKRCVSSQYSEQFSFLAPLRIGEALPGGFVIYRIEGPADLNEMDPKSMYARNLQDSMKNAKLIASFDLTDATSIGRYLRKTTSLAEYLPQSFYFRKDEDTDRYYLDWTGVSVNQPVLATVTEDITFIVKNHRSIIEFEQFITEGRTRMGIADHRTINLEFLFNDTDAAEYSVNRYVGFYVDAITTGTVSLDGERAFEFKDLDGNMPRLKRDQGGAYSADGTFYQQNASGVQLYIKPETGELPTEDTSWIKGKDGNYFGIKLGKETVNFFYEDHLHTSPYKLTLDNKKIDLGNFRGTSDKQITVPVVRGSKNSKSFFVLDISTVPGPYDRIFIEHPTGNVLCKEGNGDPTLLDCNYYLDLTSHNLWINLEGWQNFGAFSGRLPRKGFEVVANDFSEIFPATWIPGASYESYFNTAGKLKDITNSICSAINALPSELLVAQVIDGKVIVYTKANGEYDSRRAFSTFDCGNGSMSIFNFKGGTKNAIRYSTTAELAAQASDLCFVSRQGVENVKEIVMDLDTAIKTGKLDHYIIELGKEPISATKYKLILYKSQEPAVGKFKFYEWRELDGDFLDTTYAATELELVQMYYDLQESGSYLVAGKTYSVAGVGEIIHEGVNVKSGNTFVATETSFDVVSGTPIVFDKLMLDDDMVTFRGVSSLLTSPSLQEIINSGLAGKPTKLMKTVKVANPEQRLEVFNSRTRFSRFVASNEYDSLKENFTTDLSTRSRTLPWISKWVHLFGTDTRDNAYRFNMSGAFGQGNLSPSFYTKTVAPDELSHEWFYIEGLNATGKEDAWHVGDNFSNANYTDSTTDEFGRFFGTRYATFERFGADASCMFKGVQYKMPVDFTGYKFAILLRKVDITPGIPPIQSKLYKNTKYKNVVLLLEVSLLDYRIQNNVIDHVTMYSARSAKSDNKTINDTYLSAGLDFSNAEIRRTNLVVPIIDVHNADMRDEIVDVSSIVKLTAGYPYGYYEIAAPMLIREKSLVFKSGTNLFATEIDETSPLDEIVLPFMVKGFWKDNVVKVVKGGKELFHRTMERLSFGYYNQRLKDNPEDIRTFTISVDGDVVTSSMNLSTVLPSIIIKNNNPYYDSDSNRPDILSDLDVVGYEIHDRTELVKLARYTGPYVAKTRPCVWFDSDGKISNDSGIIKNMHGLKVSHKNILKDLDDMPNLYRLVDEFPLFETDINIFSSSWSKDFYKNFTTSSKSGDVKGTVELKEMENFFGNILMNLPNQIYIETFESDQFAVTVDGTIAIFDIAASITQQIINGNVDLFRNIGGDDYRIFAETYVLNNILNLYNVLDIETYVKPKETLPYEFVSLSESKRLKGGFVRSTAATVKQVRSNFYSVNVGDNLNGSHMYTVSITLELI